MQHSERDTREGSAARLLGGSEGGGGVDLLAYPFQKSHTVSPWREKLRFRPCARGVKDTKGS